MCSIFHTRTRIMNFVFLIFAVDSVPQNTKAQLENRILNILASSDNKLNTDKPSGLLPPTQTPNPTLLKDSSTIKALQTIVQNNLLGPLGSRI